MQSITDFTLRFKKIIALALILAVAGAWMALSIEHTPRTPLVHKSEKLDFKVDTVLSGLKIPWGMVFLPNGDMLFTERGGELHLYQNGKLHPDPIANVPEVLAKGQGGLLDIELHPNYKENGWIYISYSSEEGEEKGAQTALIRARLENHALVDKELVFKASPNIQTAHHYGGRIEFDREGYLYLSVGERGKRELAQDLDNYHGKVLRMHDDGSVPEDNPFVDNKNAMPEIWSYGHRNQQGMSLEPSTGLLWEHEHGPRGGDEVNIIQKGVNYGWPAITYGINYNGTIITKDTVKAGMEQPVIFWRPSIAPCGMDFVESDMYEPWQGNILVGSLKFRYLKRLEVQGKAITHQETLLENIGRVRAIEQAPDGYVYVAIEGPGMIVRLVPVNS